jgi:hypothetical protein
MYARPIGQTRDDLRPAALSPDQPEPHRRLATNPLRKMMRPVVSPSRDDLPAPAPEIVLEVGHTSRRRLPTVSPGT